MAYVTYLRNITRGRGPILFETKSKFLTVSECALEMSGRYKWRRF
jgi:hypothetical protein